MIRKPKLCTKEMPPPIGKVGALSLENHPASKAE
jgi:hypothetical protein